MKTKATKFESYVLSFYGPGEIYGHFFGGTLTLEEVRRAIGLRVKNLSLPFDGDSFDRELVRDIMLRLRGEEKTEYDVSGYVRKS